MLEPRFFIGNVSSGSEYASDLGSDTSVGKFKMSPLKETFSPAGSPLVCNDIPLDGTLNCYPLDNLPYLDCASGLYGQAPALANSYTETGFIAIEKGSAPPDSQVLQAFHRSPQSSVCRSSVDSIDENVSNSVYNQQASLSSSWPCENPSSSKNILSISAPDLSPCTSASGPVERPFYLKPHQMLDGYLKGRLCLSCDSTTHPMPKCPTGSFVCPNCHKRGHRGELCVESCRFCGCSHRGTCIMNCIQRAAQHERRKADEMVGEAEKLFENLSDTHTDDFFNRMTKSIKICSSPVQRCLSSKKLSGLSAISLGAGDVQTVPEFDLTTRPDNAWGRSVYMKCVPSDSTEEQLTRRINSLITTGYVVKTQLFGAREYAFVTLSNKKAAAELMSKRIVFKGRVLNLQWRKSGGYIASEESSNSPYVQPAVRSASEMCSPVRAAIDGITNCHTEFSGFPKHEDKYFFSPHDSYRSDPAPIAASGDFRHLSSNASMYVDSRTADSKGLDLQLSDLQGPEIRTPDLRVSEFHKRQSNLNNKTNTTAPDASSRNSSGGSTPQSPLSSNKNNVSLQLVADHLVGSLVNLGIDSNTAYNTAFKAIRSATNRQNGSASEALTINRDRISESRYSISESTLPSFQNSNYHRKMNRAPGKVDDPHDMFTIDFEQAPQLAMQTISPPLGLCSTDELSSRPNIFYDGQSSDLSFF